MKVLNVAVAGSKAEANKVKAKWIASHNYSKVTISKKKTSASLMKASPSRYNRYYYTITAWG